MPAIENKTRLTQAEIREEGKVLDPFYASLPVIRGARSAGREWVVGTFTKRKTSIMKARLETCINPTYRHVIILINDFLSLCVRFKVEGNLWTAEPILVKQGKQIVKKPALSWARQQTFSSPEQFANQYLNYRQTGKKQSGFVPQSQFPLFMESIAS